MLRSLNHRQRSFWFSIFCVLCSAFLLVLSFPSFNIWFFAWFGLVPLFFAIERRTPLQAFFLSYAAGVLFFLGTMYWLIHVTLPGMIVLILYLALYFGLFGLSLVYIVRGEFADWDIRTAVNVLFIIPAAWITLEYIRSHVFSGFGWVLLGYSQHKNLPMIQIADVVGSYGVSFLVVLVNAGIYFLLKKLRCRNSDIWQIYGDF